MKLGRVSLTGTWRDGGRPAGENNIFGLVAKQGAILRCY